MNEPGIVFARIHPHRELAPVPVSQAADFYAQSEAPLEALWIIWNDPNMPRSFAKVWFDGTNGRIVKIGAGAYGSKLVWSLAQQLLIEFGQRLAHRATPLSLGWSGNMAARECARTAKRASEADGYSRAARIV